MNLNCTNQQGKRVRKERAIFQAIHEVVNGNDGGKRKGICALGALWSA